MPSDIYLLKKESNLLHWENFCREISERKALLFFQKKSIHDPAGAKMHSQVHHKSKGTKENSVNFLAIN